MRAATTIKLLSRTACWCFYPRGRAGRDGRRSFLAALYQRFYPRGRAGRDPSSSSTTKPVEVSIRAAVRAATGSCRPCPPGSSGFYPRGRAGRDARLGCIGLSTAQFLSARPCGPRRVPGRCGCSSRTRFYPRGRAGRDLRRRQDSSAGAGFYPRGRAGRDHPCIHPCAKVPKFLSARPCGPRLRLMRRSRRCVSVSIRAAVRAATDGAIHDTLVALEFLSARPCGPRLALAVMPLRSSSSFLSARPCGPRRARSTGPRARWSVSIRAAVRAATIRTRTWTIPGRSFYPRGRAGRDLKVPAMPCSWPMFLSARPCGPRPARHSGSQSSFIGFYPRGRAGRDMAASSRGATRSKFLSARPCGPRRRRSPRRSHQA